MTRIARIGLFASLLLYASAACFWWLRDGESDAIADLALAVLLTGLMVKNPDRWVYAVAFFAIFSLVTVLAIGIWAFPAFNAALAVGLLGSAVATASAIGLIIGHRRRSSESSSARLAWSKTVLTVLLILTVGVLCQLTWRALHAAYVEPNAMAGETPPRWQMWVVDVSLDWQMNYGFWRLLLGVAIIVAIGAHAAARFSGARLYLGIYLLAISAITFGYLAMR